MLSMVMPRRSPPPWTVEEYRGISYIVGDANNFAVAYVYFERSRADALRESHDQGGGKEDRGRNRQAAGAATESR
jgi:hypothetical protein